MRIAIPAVLILSLVLAACGRSDTTSVSTPGGTVTATKSADGTTTTITGANGESAQISAGPGAKANLPDFMPLYPGATVTTSINSGSGTQKATSVAFTTSAAVAEVIDFYKKKAAAAGMTEALNMTQGDSTTFMAQKDQTMVQVIASKGANGTEAQITFAAPPGG